MTRDQILDRARKNLNDEGFDFWTSQDGVDSIQDGYDEVAMQSFCIEKSTTLARQNGILHYNLYQLISDYLAIKAVYNPNNNLWLDSITLKELQKHGPEWEKVEALSTHFCPISFEYVIFWPRYTGATFNWTIYYAAQADVLSASTVPQIPTEFQTILEDYVTADLLEQAQEMSKARRYWLSYEQKLKELKKFIKTRVTMDRVPHLTGVGR